MQQSIEIIFSRAISRRNKLNEEYEKCEDNNKKADIKKEINCISKTIQDYENCEDKEGTNNLILEYQKKIDSKILPFKKYQLKGILTKMTKYHHLNIEKGRCFAKHDEVFAISLAVYHKQWNPFFSQSEYGIKGGKCGILIHVEAGTKYTDANGEEQTIEEPINDFFETKNEVNAVPSKMKQRQLPRRKMKDRLQINAFLQNLAMFNAFLQSAGMFNGYQQSYDIPNPHQQNIGTFNAHQQSYDIPNPHQQNTGTFNAHQQNTGIPNPHQQSADIRNQPSQNGPSDGDSVMLNSNQDQEQNDELIPDPEFGSDFDDMFANTSS